MRGPTVFPREYQQKLFAEFRAYYMSVVMERMPDEPAVQDGDS
jgi:hypothetical protein